MTEPIDPRLLCLACKKLHAGARLVSLPDGTLVGNHSEAWRAHCEAVYVAGLPTKLDRNRFLWGSSDGKIKGVAQRRGVESANRLRQAVIDLWKHRSPPADGEG